LLCVDGARVDETMIDWLDTGWRVFKEDWRDADSFPPLDDMEAQWWWLGGFGAARALAGRGELMRQLRSHRAG
jgi:hypothetical protein